MLYIPHVQLRQMLFALYESEGLQKVSTVQVHFGQVYDDHFRGMSNGIEEDCMVYDWAGAVISSPLCRPPHMHNFLFGSHLKIPKCFGASEYNHLSTELFLLIGYLHFYLSCRARSALHVMARSSGKRSLVIKARSFDHPKFAGLPRRPRHEPISPSPSRP